jgi:hypothetical protein
MKITYLKPSKYENYWVVYDNNGHKTWEGISADKVKNKPVITDWKVIDEILNGAEFIWPKAKDNRPMSKKITQYLIKLLFQWSALQLRKAGEDMRMHFKDGELSFQGGFKAAGQITIPRRRE